MELPENAEGGGGMSREEPLPEEGWTMELWAVNYGDKPCVPFTLRIGDQFRADETERTSGRVELKVEPGGDHATVQLTVETPGAGGRAADRHNDVCTQSIASGAGPIHQVLVAYNAETGSLRAAVNGTPIILDAQPVILSPATVRVSARGTAGKGGAGFELAGFSVGPWRDLQARPVRGLAFGGWQGELQTEELAAAARVPVLLDWVLQNPGLSPDGRAYALAARAFYERATAGAVAQDTWASIGELAATAKPHTVSLLLPIAVACGSPQQQDEGDGWVQALFESLRGKKVWEAPEERILRRLALLDPVAVVRAPATSHLTDEGIEELVGPVAGTDPEAALGFYCCRMVGHAGESFAAPMAWLLGDIAKSCPTYSVLAGRWLQDFGAREPVHVDRQQNVLSFGAYCLAGLLPQDAMSVWEAITDPAVKAETLTEMAGVLPPGAVPDLDTQTEENMRLAIEHKRETTDRRTAVPEIVELAEFRANAGRTEEAVAAVREAMAEVNEDAEALCYDLRRIATVMRKLEMPEADEWWDRALAKAVETDRQFQGIEEGGGMVYLAPTSFMVRDLVEQGQVDRALEVAESLNTGSLPSNYGNALSRIIYAVAKTDLPRALELLDRVPQGTRARSSLIVRFIPLIAADDPDRAMALVSELPERVHPYWRYRILVAPGGEPPPEAQQLGTELTAARLALLKPGPEAWANRDTFLAGLQDQPLASVLALEPQLAAQPEFLAHQLLASCVHSAGLSEDELWQRYDKSHHSYPGFGTTDMVRLKDVLYQREARAAAAARG